MFRSLTRAALLLGVTIAPVRAQTPDNAAGDPAQDAHQQPTPEQIFEQLRQIAHASPGPLTRDLGDVAQLAIPEGLFFADKDGTRRLLQATGNHPGPSQLATVLAPPAAGDWFAVFSFNASGHVKDDDKDELDADDLLDTIREDQEADNERRRSEGLGELEIVAWQKPPFYDEHTHNLTWALLIRSNVGGESINWQVRLLGREGYMDAQLVCSPADLDRSLPSFEKLIEGFAYKDGKQYAQYVEGDHLAEYGLGGLVAGGGVFAAAKLGFFGKFWKVIVGAWKLVLIAAVGIGAGVKKFFGKVVGGEQKPNESHKSG
jgi:uncharacterized membrane-anchored protein